MDSRILKEIYETAKGMYEAGTMRKEVYTKFKDIYEDFLSETCVNKFQNKSK